MRNGNRTELSLIWSVIMSDLKKLEDPGAGVRYVNYKSTKSRKKYKKRYVVLKKKQQQQVTQQSTWQQRMHMTRTIQ